LVINVESVYDSFFATRVTTTK